MTTDAANRQIVDSGGHLEQDCWCNPRVEQVCPECRYFRRPALGRTRPLGEPGCWRCGGDGFVPPFDDDEPCIIIHTAETYPPGAHASRTEE